jgi:hypothetical protein
LAKKSSPLKGREAKIIAKKLSTKADIKQGRHIRATIRYDNEVIGQFGWRNDKTASNGHIPNELKISLHDTLEIARCNIDKSGYIELLRIKNLL